MTFKDLVRAYITDPSIEAYVATIVVSLVIGIIALPSPLRFFIVAGPV